MAQAQASDLNRADTLRLARMLLSEEILALQAIADAEQDPLAEHRNWADEFRAATAASPAEAPALLKPQPDTNGLEG